MMTLVNVQVIHVVLRCVLPVTVCGSKRRREPFQGHWRVPRTRRWIFRTRWQWDRWLTTFNISHCTNLKKGGRSYERLCYITRYITRYHIWKGCTQEISQHHWSECNTTSKMRRFFVQKMSSGTLPIDSYPTDRSLIDGLGEVSESTPSQFSPSPEWSPWLRFTVDHFFVQSNFSVGVLG